MVETEYVLLLLRVVIGLLFIGHGTQKLFGWFGGHGLKGTAGFFESLDVHPPQLWALIAALSETLGGLGLVLGFLTPLAAVAIIATMLMAVIKVHAPNGLWNSNKGYEYNLVIITVAAAIGLAGPGALAVDNVLDLGYPMPITFIAALIIAIIGILGALTTGQVEEQPETRTQS